METVVEECEKQLHGIPEGHTLIVLAAIESAEGVMKALDICEASERMFGIALSVVTIQSLQTHITGTGLELMGRRQNMMRRSPCGRCTVL